jgi:macrolide transport system ATP-binding/permease protein
MAFSAQGISKEYDHRAVLEKVSIGLNPGGKLALIGANGTGKSTLLRILAGQEAPDEGVVNHSARDEIGYLSQSLPIIKGETIQDVITASVAGLKSLERRMRELEQRMVESTDDETLAEYGDVVERFEARGGYEIDARMDEVLASLGVSYLARDRLISGLSGGERARVALTALLLGAPDVLLLDEPTNDLDDRALTWLEGYLKAYKGSVLFVTHDRDFIDAVATAILELDEHTHALTRYEGNYGRYLDAKRAARIRAQQAYDIQQEEIAQLRKKAVTTSRSVGCGRASSDNDKRAYNFRGAGVERTISRNVRAVMERLDRIEANLLLPPPEPLRFRASFAAGRLRPGTVALQAHDLSVRYGERVVFGGINCLLRAESRVCLVGPNGAGKSTLLRILAQQDTPQSGDVWWAPGLRIGYLSQEPRLPDADATVAANITLGLRQAGLTSVTDEARGWLVRWGLFTRDDLTKQARDLSVGQRRKLELGILLGESPDALLLDEPTNHLSFDVIESLQAALLEFQGPVLVVTHDRRLIREFPGTLWSLEGGHLTVAEFTVEVAISRMRTDAVRL